MEKRESERKRKMKTKMNRKIHPNFPNSSIAEYSYIFASFEIQLNLCSFFELENVLINAAMVRIESEEIKDVEARLDG